MGNVKTKTVNRIIPENRENRDDRFRVRYRDKTTFDILEVNIRRNKTDEVHSFRFRSNELPDKDSIHFSTRIKNGKFEVIWKGIAINNNRMNRDGNESD